MTTNTSGVVFDFLRGQSFNDGEKIREATLFDPIKTDFGVAGQLRVRFTSGTVIFYTLETNLPSQGKVLVLTSNSGKPMPLSIIKGNTAAIIIDHMNRACTSTDRSFVQSPVTLPARPSRSTHPFRLSPPARSSA